MATTHEFLKRVYNSKAVGVPIMGITTTDATATMEALNTFFTSETSAFANSIICQWNIQEGLKGLNSNSHKMLMDCFAKSGQDLSKTNDPAYALKAVLNLPEHSTVFVQNASHFITNVKIIQSISIIRDHFKSDARTLILLSPCLSLPVELQNDALIFDEPLPTKDVLKSILIERLDTVSEVGNNFPYPSEKEIESACKALQGLNCFAAEQVVALSVNSKGLNMKELWSRKKQMIEATPGLSVVDNPEEKFDNIGGLANIKKFMRQVINGNESPECIVLIDEIEKAMGGSNDSSGVSQGFLGTLLTYMQENKVTGIIQVSPPGCGKSAIAKAAGQEANIPTIMFDINGMKGSLVGESEKNLRTGLKTISAVAQGKAFFIATCNSIVSLPPELKRRFTFGTFFLDLPDEEERKQIWNIWIKKFNLLDSKVPDSEGWSGANIHDCCLAAYRLNCSLIEASEYIVPISKSAKEEIESLRIGAHGRYTSASKPGVYCYEQSSEKTEKSSKKRAVVLD